MGQRPDFMGSEGRTPVLGVSEGAPPVFSSRRRHPVSQKARENSGRSAVWRDLQALGGFGRVVARCKREQVSGKSSWPGLPRQMGDRDRDDCGRRRLDTDKGLPRALGPGNNRRNLFGCNHLGRLSWARWQARSKNLVFVAAPILRTTRAETSLYVAITVIGVWSLVVRWLASHPHRVFVVNLQDTLASKGTISQTTFATDDSLFLRAEIIDKTFSPRQYAEKVPTFTFGDMGTAPHRLKVAFGYDPQVPRNAAS